MMIKSLRLMVNQNIHLDYGQDGFEARLNSFLVEVLFIR